MPWMRPERVRWHRHRNGFTVCHWFFCAVSCARRLSVRSWDQLAPQAPIAPLGDHWGTTGEPLGPLGKPTRVGGGPQFCPFWGPKHAPSFQRLGRISDPQNPSTNTPEVGDNSG